MPIGNVEHCPCRSRIAGDEAIRLATHPRQPSPASRIPQRVDQPTNPRMIKNNNEGPNKHPSAV